MHKSVLKCGFRQSSRAHPRAAAQPCSVPHRERSSVGLSGWAGSRGGTVCYLQPVQQHWHPAVSDPEGQGRWAQLGCEPATWVDNVHSSSPTMLNFIFSPFGGHVWQTTVHLLDWSANPLTALQGPQAGSPLITCTFFLKATVAISEKSICSTKLPHGVNWKVI